MMDEVEAKGDVIDCKSLSENLGVQVIPIVAKNRRGLDELMEAVSQTILLKKTEEKITKKPVVFDKMLLGIIEEIKESLNSADESKKYWTAVKLAEARNNFV